ncbi:MAG: EAL domain-containing protein [Acidimicrobiia bacterium]
MVSDRRLSELLGEFARTLMTDYPIQSILDHLVRRIVEVLPIGSASVTLISETGETRHVAASDESALRFVELQTENGQGPCIAAFRTGETVAIPDLRHDTRFPEFSTRAIEEGLAAVFSFPLRDYDHRLGALDLYRTTAGTMDAEAMAAAQTLADVTTAYLLNAQARADLEEASERDRHRSLHDPLTGLPNRTLLVERLDHAMLRCRRSKKMVAVFYTDLDGFKSINDSYGHQIGDQLLVAVAERLTNLLRPGDTVARLSGDEFVILCEDLDEAVQAEPLAERIGAAMREPFVVSGTQLHVSASVGIAFAGLADDIPHSVLDQADAAMYEAKRQGGGRHAIIDLRDHRVVSHRARLNQDLRGAVRRGEMEVHYQPIVATGSGQVTGAEALLRWHHPAFGMVHPDVMIPLAEQSGLIGDIGRWVMEQACRDRKRWVGQTSREDLGVSVNISIHQLMAPGFASLVSTVLSDTETQPNLMTLEVTESVLVSDRERALTALVGLKNIGVALALDDFGTGQSSLSHLKHFPMDTVKIDRGFIGDLETSLASRLIVRAVVGLAHGLNMAVVAEGVETAGQRMRVAEMSCDFSQGYLFARPRSAEDLSALLGDRQTLPLRRTAPAFSQLAAASPGTPGHTEHWKGARTEGRGDQ